MTDAPPEALLLGRLDTPIGTALLVTDQEGVLRAFNWTDYEDHLRRWLRRFYSTARLTEGVSPVAGAFRAYFAGEAGAFDEVPWAAAGTAFQRSVWDGLMSIPLGETVSYQWLATRIGRPTAMRAVGLANGANPLSVIVPCHRVIGANGALTGYGGGLPRKRWLLAHERTLAERMAA